MWELEPYHRTHYIGIESLVRQVESLKRAAKHASGFPPHNIVQTDENKYVVELAVAGFAKEDLTVELKDSVLSISGKSKDDESTSSDNPDQKYLHKGIAQRAFTRSFTLSDTIEVNSAEFENGILKIYLDNIIPEHKKPRQIAIK